jgi:hypothetical protein
MKRYSWLQELAQRENQDTDEPFSQGDQMGHRGRHRHRQCEGPEGDKFVLLAATRSEQRATHRSEAETLSPSTHRWGLLVRGHIS